MATTVIPFTVVYSSESVEPAKIMVNTFFDIFYTDPTLNFDSIFYCGVFCKPETYANYFDWESIPADVEIPIILTSESSTNSERLEFVNKVIVDIMMGVLEKPEWMVQVEANQVCNKVFSPSTFLYIKPKNKKYEPLAEAMVNFLYSPNLMTTLLEDKE